MNYPAFLASIRDEPENDLPRLVCADWFDDEGQADRAEFIRIQVELTRGTSPRPRAVELLRRLRALIVTHRNRWLGVLTAHAPASMFERGFVEQVELQAGALLAVGAVVFDEHPIYRLILRAVGGQATALAACPRLSCLMALDLRENAADAVVTVCESPHLARLRRLDARSVGLDAKRLRRVVGALGGLEGLDVAGNRLGNAGIEELTLVPRLTGLHHLDVGSASVGDAGARMLAGAPYLRDLETLRLSHNRVSEAGIREVLESPRLPALRQVEAIGTEMDADTRARLRRTFGKRLVC